MKVAHWVLKNGSGMFRVAEDMCSAEVAFGVNSVLVEPGNKETWEHARDADIHVNHTHIPEGVMKSGSKMVWVGHGTLEHCFTTSVEDGLHQTYGAGDTWMLVQHWLQHADALVTFWPRQQALWQTMVDNGRTVYCVPMGVDTNFWKPQQSQGRWAGSPTVLTAENCHQIKWPLDLVLMWPFVTAQLPEAKLHMLYLPSDQHRWWLPLMYRNGAAYKAYITGAVFDRPNLLNAFNSVDYYCGLVRYGDVNRICLEAKASGLKVISFRGNPYADFWLTEGNQLEQAREMLNILNGVTLPREDVAPVPDIKDMANKMLEIYARVL
jgi:hypothetical protein